MFLEAMTFIFSMFSTLFGFVLGISFGGITLGQLYFGMIIMGILMGLLMKFIGIASYFELKEAYKGFKKPGSHEVKK